MNFRVPHFRQARVLVVGDVMLDRYWRGDVARISPEAPVPVVAIGGHEDRAGGAANVAMNLAALGVTTGIVGLVGRDEPAAGLRAILEGAGIACSFVESADEPTIVKLRVIARDQQLIRLDMEKPFRSTASAEIANVTRERLAGAEVLVLSDYGKNTLADVPALVDMARALGRPVFVDPKGTDFGRYAGVTLLKPNLAEFEAVVGPCGSVDEMVARGQALIGSLGIRYLLVTRGKQGMTLIGSDGHVRHYGARAKEVYDVTGAGDTVIALIAAAVAAGDEIGDAIGLANLAAGLVVGKLGTATVTETELRRAASEARGPRRGVTTREQLIAEVAEARAAGERVVFTNGCFDILHAGHVQYLEQARALGDRLVVAVNTDASVRRLKGPERPFNPVEHRMLVLAGLQAVDWVVPFEEDTPIPLLEAIRPDVLAKGGDYSVEQVVGGDVVRAYGGEVAVLSVVENCSTTDIVRLIRERG